MALTLANYKASSENAIFQQVIDEFRGNSILLDTAPIDAGANPNAGGSAWVYQYDRVSTEPTAAVREVGSDYTAQEAITTAYTVECKIMGGSFNVDRTQINTARYGDRIAFQMGQKIKATTALVHDLFINGDDSSSALEFDGVDVAVTGTSTEYNASGSIIDLSSAADVDSNYKTFLDNMDEWLSSMDGTPSMLLMNRTMRARMYGIARRAGYLTESEDAFGRRVAGFAGIPFVDLGDKDGTSNPIVETTADSSSLDTTNIYAVRLGLDGVHFVAPSLEENFIRQYMPDLNEPGVNKKGEVEIVTAVAVKNTRAAGVFRNIGVSA